VQIVSASRRSDIPAFYSRWFINRVRAGFCHTINPFGGQVRRVSLRPEDTLGFVFWTRHAKPLERRLDDLRDYRYYFHVTVNGYGPALERRNPRLEQAVAGFRRLADRISPARVNWRYDPIVLGESTPPEYHLRHFDELARELEGYTSRCYFSFVSVYGKTKRNMGATGLSWIEPGAETRAGLSKQLAAIAASRGIALLSCCEDALVCCGVGKARCVDGEILGLDQPLRSVPSRPQCGCVESVDIGAYDTCQFDCTYCYATNSWTAARRRAGAHDPEDTVLWRPSTMRGLDLDTRCAACP
jgi:hypothetical protein